MILLIFYHASYDSNLMNELHKQVLEAPLPLQMTRLYLRPDFKSVYNEF